MSNLKRSQKLCPKCGKKNFIRQFNCSSCNFEFPKKDKSHSQNCSIEQFFFKMPNIVKSENKNNKADNIIINLDEEEEERSAKSLSRGRKKKNVENIEKKFDKDEIIEINSIKLNNFFSLLEKKGIKNKILIEKNDEIEKYIQINYENDLIKKRINSIVFQNASIFPPQSFDICPIDGINSFFISILFREENQIDILTNVIIHFNKDSANSKIKVYQNESKEENKEDTKLLYNQSISTQIIACNDVYLLYSITYKNILQCNLVNFSSNNQNNLEIFKITSKNLITKTDFNIDHSKDEIRILFSDSENNLFYYLYDQKNIDNSNSSNLKLIGIYDYLFLYKITDIKFLNVKNKTEYQNDIFFFMVSSRDGLLYILNNLGDIIFQHKTNQTWITQCLYDCIHNLILFLTNFDDKIVGVKFNVNKDPIIKRIPNTNNTYCIQMTPFMDKVYYLDEESKIYYLSTYIIEDMFKASKLKKGNDYNPKFVYKLEEKDKNMFLNKFKLIGNNKSIRYDKNNKNILMAFYYNKDVKFVYI